MNEIYRVSEARQREEQHRMNRCRYHMQQHYRGEWRRFSAHRLRWVAIFRARLTHKNTGCDCRVIDTKEVEA